RINLFLFVPMTAIIRKAKLMDLPDLVEMGSIFFNEAAWGDVCDWDDEDAFDSLKDMIYSDDHIILVAEKENKIVGMAGAALFQVWFSKKTRLGQEYMLYVIPEHRGGVGKKLKDALEEEACVRNTNAFAM